MGMKSNLKFFKGKKVFITGHTGFKGSWLTYLLDQNGAITKGYSLKPNTHPSLYLNLKFSKNHTSVFSDINDYNCFKREVNLFEPDFIFHLAAQPLVLESYENPKATFETNFNGTLNLLELLKEYEPPCSVIFITTDKVYENNELNIAFKEEDKLGGNDPYSSSKAASELLIHSYQTSFFKNSKIHIASARAGNVIGGGDWSNNRLIPDIIRSIYENKKIEIRNPLATRPWQHILEPLNGYLMLAIALSQKPLFFNRPWNFGPETGDVKTVKEIIDISDRMGINLKFKVVSNIGKKEANSLSLNIERAKNQLTWRPIWKSEKAIEHALKWYNGFYSGKSANELINYDLKSFIK